jgi:hypothetical protein
MNILFAGDSNFRDLFTHHRDQIEGDLGEKIRFEMVTSVASLSTLITGLERSPDIFILGPPTNEIALKSRNNTRAREGIIESVVTEFYNQVSDYSVKSDTTCFVICQPFLRLDPPWLDNKMDFYKEFLKTTHNNGAHSNVHLGSIVDLEGEDLKPDKVHLNKEGLKKLAKVVQYDLRIAKKEYRVLRNGPVDTEGEQAATDMDVEDIPLSQSGRKLRSTPARRKRPIEESDDEIRSRKKKTKDGKIDSVLDKLDLLVSRLDQDREATRDRFDRVESRLEETVLAQEILKKEIKDIKSSDSTFSAAMREDLDAVENNNSRDTVVIKKMEYNGQVPTERKELSNIILNIGKDLVKTHMGDDKIIKFIAPLFYKNERRAPNAGSRVELPPFKITFKHLADAVNFKEKAIAASKIPGDKLHKSYIANIQNVGTRVRSTLMWSIAEQLKKEKKDSWVTQGSVKPALVVKVTGNLTKTFGFIEAMINYGDKIDKKAKEEATKLASRFFYGQLEKVFIVLKD